MVTPEPSMTAVVVPPRCVNSPRTLTVTVAPCIAVDGDRFRLGVCSKTPNVEPTTSPPVAIWNDCAPTQVADGIVRASSARVGVSIVTVLTVTVAHPGWNGANATDVDPCCQCVPCPVTVTVTTPPCGPLAGETDPIAADDG